MQTPPFGISGGVKCGGGIWFWGWERFAGWKGRAFFQPMNELRPRPLLQIAE